MVCTAMWCALYFAHAVLCTCLPDACTHIYVTLDVINKVDVRMLGWVLAVMMAVVLFVGVFVHDL